MLYKSPSDWNTSQSKSIMLFGMSGLEKHIFQNFCETMVIGFITV